MTGGRGAPRKLASKGKGVSGFRSPCSASEGSQPAVRNSSALSLPAFTSSLPRPSLISGAAPAIPRRMGDRTYHKTQRGTTGETEGPDSTWQGKQTFASIRHVRSQCKTGEQVGNRKYTWPDSNSALAVVRRQWCPAVGVSGLTGPRASPWSVLT